MMGRFDCENTVARRGLTTAVWSGIAFGFLCSHAALPATDKPAAPPASTPPAKPGLVPRDEAEQRRLEEWRKLYQTISLGPPPRSGGEFNPDTGGVAMPPLPLLPEEFKLRLRTTWSLGAPPLAPLLFNPDLPNPPLRLPLFHDRVSTDAKWDWIVPPPKAPAQFNPDPGARNEPRKVEPFFKSDPVAPPPFGSETVASWLALPRGNTRRLEAQPDQIKSFPNPLDEPVPSALALPRARTRSGEAIEERAGGPTGDPNLKPLSQEESRPRGPIRRTLRIDDKLHHTAHAPFQEANGLPPNTEARPDRWRIPFAPWRRYTSGDTLEMPYYYPEPELWHPYKLSVLKGDLPIYGQDIFLNLVASTSTEWEARTIPVPSGVSAARPGAGEFFGRSEVMSVQNNISFAIELFKGETVFKPIEWAIKLQPVYNINYLQAEETGVVSPDPRGSLGGGLPNTPPPSNTGVINPGDVNALLNGQLGTLGDSLAGRRHTQRTKDFWALQEWSVEVHLRDLSDNYDFIAMKVGNQPFSSDFRGFIFNDINFGGRLFGNAANNRFQYNLLAFDMREKDSNSGLNTFNARNQQVLIANLFWQDFLTKGYTALWSFHANWDEAGTHYDRNGAIVRPAPVGEVREHNVAAYYLGWGGDGHIGRWNITHQFYQVFGRDQFNGIAGRAVDINAQMAALEVSYDRDWLRYKASFFYASGDGDAGDSHGNGFDTIIDNPNFTGGPFSYYVRQGFNLASSGVGLKQGGSLVPNLRTSKTQGQANFVNPGLWLVGLGLDADVTPKLKSFLNVNYLMFANTDSIKTVLLTDKVNRELGLDMSLGFQYRPVLTDNIIISAGAGVLLPGRGYRDIYRTATDPVPNFAPTDRPGRVDSFLYSGIVAVTLTY